jgi:alkyldihydroxyacetonephosphate synthase
VVKQRALSFWGWGYADKFPGGVQRRLVAGRLRATLGFAAGKPRRPPVLDEIRLDPPPLEPPKSLAGVCSAEHEDRRSGRRSA